MPRWKIRIPPSLCCPGMSGRWLGTARTFLSFSLRNLFLQEARTTPHELRAMKHRYREVGYCVLWDARRQLAFIARHGLNLCQIRGPECVEGYKQGYYALQLRDTRVLLRNVQYPFEGPSERAKLEQELESFDIARSVIDFGVKKSRPTLRIGDHVLIPNLKTWRKNVGPSTFVC